MGRVMFICSGNTCRSPLAAAIAAARLGEDGVRCESAGLDAAAGCPATAESCAEAAARGLDLQRHRSRAVMSLALDGVVWVIGMTADHVARFVGMRPDYRGRVGLLGLPGVDLAAGGEPTAGEPVDDPYRHGTDAAYAAMAAQVDRLVAAWVEVLRTREEP